MTMNLNHELLKLRSKRLIVINQSSTY